MVADPNSLDLPGRLRVKRRPRLRVGRVGDNFRVVRLDHVDRDLVVPRESQDLGARVNRIVCQFRFERGRKARKRGVC